MPGHRFAFAGILHERCLAPEGERPRGGGYDGRLSSPMLEAALVEGLVAGGVDVSSACPPRRCSISPKHRPEVQGGIQVTGSHNPKDHNGFKIVCGSPSSARIAKLGERIEAAGQGDDIAASGIGGAIGVEQGRGAPRVPGRLRRPVAGRSGWR
jgi:phosphomannomutase